WRDRYDDRYPITCHGKFGRFFRSKKLVRTVEVSCSILAKMSRKSWSTCQPVSKSSAIFAPSLLVRVAIESCRPKRQVDRSSEALLVLGFWRTCWYRNTVTTCLSIVNRRSMLVPALSWIAPPWRSGSADPAGCSRRWWKRCDVTCWLRTNYTRMTRRFRCWHPGWARPKQGGCGLTCETIVPQATAHPLPCGSRIHRIARANTLNLI